MSLSDSKGPRCGSEPQPCLQSTGSGTPGYRIRIPGRLWPGMWSAAPCMCQTHSRTSRWRTIPFPHNRRWTDRRHRARWGSHIR